MRTETSHPDGKGRVPAATDRLFNAIDGRLVICSNHLWRIEVFGIYADRSRLWVQCLANDERDQRRPVTVSVAVSALDDAVVAVKAALRDALR